ncbi:hypothetical protein ACFYU2_45825, partial [Streptomyces sp. NPDC004296]
PARTAGGQSLYTTVPPQLMPLISRLHAHPKPHYFEPTARAIAGLESALAGLGLLDDALALDLRKPQDYFHRVWSTAFRAADLADAADHDEDEYGESGTAIDEEASA